MELLNDGFGLRRDPGLAAMVVRFCALLLITIIVATIAVIGLAGSLSDRDGSRRDSR